MKKDKWVKAYSNTQYGEDDDDNDKYWFWINKSGDVYVPDDSKETGIGATRYKLDDCEGDTFDDQFKEDMSLVPQHVSTLLQAITKMRATSTLLVSMVLRAASFTAMVSL